MDNEFDLIGSSGENVDIPTDTDMVTDEVIDLPEVQPSDTMEEEILQDTTEQPTAFEVEDMTPDAMWEEEQLETSDTDDAPKVLKRDEGEMWAIGTNAIEDRLEMMRDDLRDKGWPDGPELEAMVAEQRPKLLEEFQRDMQGDFSQPYQDPVFPEYSGDSSTGSETTADMPDAIYSEAATDQSDVSAPGDGLVLNQEELTELSDQESVDDEATEMLETLNEEVLTVDASSEDTTVTESGETSSQPTSDYPSGFDYSNVDWERTYDEIEDEQQAFENEQQFTPLPDHSEELVEDPETDLLPLTHDIQEDSVDVTPLNDVSNWLGEVNPNYDEFDPESPYCNNCGSCAYAVYQRLEGNPDACASAENIGYNSEMNALTGMEQVSMSPQEIEQRLLAQGNGAHAIIGVDRAEGAGHWFNAACINGRVVAIDGQSGEVSDWPPDYGNVVNWEMSIRR